MIIGLLVYTGSALYYGDYRDLSQNYDEGGNDFEGDPSLSPPLLGDGDECGNVFSRNNPRIQTTNKKYCSSGGVACESIGKSCNKIEFKRSISFFWKDSHKFDCSSRGLPSLNYRAVCN